MEGMWGRVNKNVSIRNIFLSGILYTILIINYSLQTGDKAKLRF